MSLEALLRNSKVVHLYSLIESKAILLLTESSWVVEGFVLILLFILVKAYKLGSTASSSQAELILVILVAVLTLVEYFFELLAEPEVLEF